MFSGTAPRCPKTSGTTRALAVEYFPQTPRSKLVYLSIFSLAASLSLSAVSYRTVTSMRMGSARSDRREVGSQSLAGCCVVRLLDQHSIGLPPKVFGHFLYYFVVPVNVVIFRVRTLPDDIP